MGGCEVAHCFFNLNSYFCYGNFEILSMEIGDILYIIILIFFMLSGVIKKLMPAKKENQTSQKPPVSTNETIKDFDDWFNQSDEYKEIVIAPKVPKEPFIPPAVNSQLKYQEQKLNTKLTKTIDKSILEENNNKIEIELDTAEEARKAFIYSEIFQRKY